jgi:short-subunit dehydrogenase
VNAQLLRTLQGKRILITGASSGIGMATAHGFSQYGCKLGIAARRMDRLKILADQLSSRAETLPIEMDISEWDHVNDGVEKFLDRFGGIDLLINNAGMGRLNWFEKMDVVADIDAQIRTNLIGSMYMSRRVVPEMQRQGSGHIINVGSIAGMAAMPTYSIYAASKYGLRGFSEALRREIGPWGISVSNLSLGGVQTEFGEKAGIRRRTGMTTPSWLVLSAEKAAEAIIQLSLRPRRNWIVPVKMLPVVWFNRLFPGIADQIIRRKFVLPERGDEIGQARE